MSPYVTIEAYGVERCFTADLGVATTNNEGVTSIVTVEGADVCARDYDLTADRAGKTDTLIRAAGGDESSAVFVDVNGDRIADDYLLDVQAARGSGLHNSVLVSRQELYRYAGDAMGNRTLDPSLRPYIVFQSGDSLVAQEPGWHQPKQMDGKPSYKDHEVSFADVNGDGQTDIVIDLYRNEYRLNIPELGQKGRTHLGTYFLIAAEEPNDHGGAESKRP